MKAIAITGGTGSGKSTLAKLLQSELDCTLISEDDYYHDNARSPGFDPKTFNFDSPQARDHSLLVDHLLKLKSGEPVQRPTYCFKEHKRLPAIKQIVPESFLLIEGLHLLCDPQLRAHWDFSIFIDVPADIRLARRLMRDLVERQRTPRSVVDQYLLSVRPAHERYIEPSKAFASLVLKPEVALVQGEHTQRCHLLDPVLLELQRRQWLPQRERVL